MLPDWTTIGFTGHREIKDAATVIKGINDALDRIASLRNPIAGVSSAASGSDTLFLEEINKRNIPFFLLLPFHRSQFKKDFTPTDWQRVEPILAKALNIEELGDSENTDEAYMETGIRVVNQADIIIAVWNCMSARGMGGTAEVIEYARKLGKPIIIINSSSGELKEERLKQLASSNTATVWNGKPRQAVEKQFEKLDQEAIKYQPRASQYFLYIIILHLIAATVAVIAFKVSDYWITVLVIAEILCLLFALVMVNRHKLQHHSWVLSRIGAELCRSFLAIWHLRGHSKPLSPIGGPALSRLYNSLCMAWYMDGPGDQELIEARDNYLQFRIKEQINYFKNNLEKTQPRLKLLKIFATSATIGSIISAVLVLVLSLEVMKISAVILPLISTAMLSRIVAQDYFRRSVRYAEMLSILEDAARQLSTTQTWHSLTRIALETEGELLHEILEWHSISRFAGEAH